MTVQDPALSDASEIIETCYCRGELPDGKYIDDCVACDGEKCVKLDKWYHAQCAGLSKRQYEELQNDKTLKWYCRDCVKLYESNEESLPFGLPQAGQAMQAREGEKVPND